MAEAAIERAPGERADRRRTLAALTACHTINDFYGLLLPPLLPAIRVAFGLSYSQAGVIPFVSTGLSAVLQPTLGYLADRRGIRRRLLLAGFVTLAVATLVLGRASGYWGLLFAAGLLGLGASVYHPQSATILAYAFDRGRGRAQGVHGIGNALGFVLAPVVVAYLAERLRLAEGRGWAEATALLAVPALAAAGIAALALREPPVRGSPGLLAGVTRPLVLLTVVTGLGLATSTGYLTWLPSFYHSRGEGLLVSGALTAAMSTTAFVAQPLGGSLSDRLGRRNVVSASLLGASCCLALFVAAPTLTTMVPLSLLVGFCLSLLPPVTMVYASELAAGERTGMAVGVVWGVGTAISAFAPLVAGRLIDAQGFGAAYLVLAAAAAAAGLLALLLPGPAAS